MIVELGLARTRLAGMPDAQKEDQRREQGYANQLDQGRQGAGWLPVRYCSPRAYCSSAL